MPTPSLIFPFEQEDFRVAANFFYGRGRVRFFRAFRLVACPIRTRDSFLALSERLLIILVSTSSPFLFPPQA